jgi:hypothetical protein
MSSGQEGRNNKGLNSKFIIFISVNKNQGKKTPLCQGRGEGFPVLSGRNSGRDPAMEGAEENDKRRA